MDLKEAIILGDIAAVRRSLPFHVGSDELDEALLTAVTGCKPDIAELIIKVGADPDVRVPAIERPELEGLPMSPDDEAEFQAEMERIREEFGDYEFVSYTDLLVLYCDPGEPDEGTALLQVCIENLVVTEIGARAHPEDRAAQRAGWMTRLQAARAGLVDVLIAAGADIEARDSKQQTPLLAATSPRGTGALVMLVQENNVEYLEPADPTPIVERLLAAGADSGACDRTGRTALMHIAAIGPTWDTPGRPSLLATLLAAGADVNARSERGYTPLLYAASHGHSDYVRALLAAGADLAARDENDFTPLHHAVHHNSTASKIPGTIAIVDLLLQAGADIHARGARGRTPLHIAAGCNAPPDAVRALLAAGASAALADELGKTPHDLAVGTRSEDLIPILARASKRC